MPKIHMTIHIQGGFRNRDDERAFIQLARQYISGFTNRAIANFPNIIIKEVTAGGVEPDEND